MLAQAPKILLDYLGAPVLPPFAGTARGAQMQAKGAVPVND